MRPFPSRPALGTRGSWWPWAGLQPSGDKPGACWEWRAAPPTKLLSLDSAVGTALPLKHGEGACPPAPSLGRFPCGCLCLNKRPSVPCLSAVACRRPGMGAAKSCHPCRIGSGSPCGLPTWWGISPVPCCQRYQQEGAPVGMGCHRWEEGAVLPRHPQRSRGLHVVQPIAGSAHLLCVCWRDRELPLAS